MRSTVRRALAVVAGACVVGSSVAAAVTGGPASVATPAARVEPQSRALLVSDSAWLGIKTYGAIDAVQGFEHMLDLGSCRRRVSSSCVNYDGHRPITLLDEVRWRGGSFDTLIVATGYNDGDLHFRDDVDAIVSLAGRLGYRRIVWLTLRANVAYRSPGGIGFAEVFERNNRALRELAASPGDPEIVVADWAVYARDRPAWFAPDGIHLRGDGPWAAADYISRKVASLDGRACPRPPRPGVAVEVPCPDPDATGPVADIGELYPVGLPNPTAGFLMEWQGHGSWPAPPWWER